MVISGKQIISKLQTQIRSIIGKYKGHPHINIVLNIEHEASVSYVKSIEKAARTNGFRITLYEIDSNTSEDEIYELLHAISKDTDVDGIIVTKPYPVRMKREFMDIVPQWKDIDGQTSHNTVALYKKEDGLFPATPLAVLEFFKEVNYDLKGKHVVIIGRSNTVGIPLFHLILSLDATCTVCHSKTPELSRFTQRADVVISAAGVPALLDDSMVENATFLVDVAINFKDGKIVGDMNLNLSKTDYEEDLVFVTPVPGGVGPVTTYMLLLNTLKGMEKRGKLKIQ